MRDGREFAVEHLRKVQHVVALTLQHHAQRADPMRGLRLAQAQLFDDEVEQLAPLLDVRPGQ
ncbi:MAG: hypothetical protein JF606_08375 [Burkholderiales bacterium]|nr:hypothetical protein [Burkholderiales bacterium]